MSSLFPIRVLNFLVLPTLSFFHVLGPWMLEFLLQTFSCRAMFLPWSLFNKSDFLFPHSSLPSVYIRVDRCALAFEFLVKCFGMIC